MHEIDVETRQGLARVHVRAAPRARAVLILGHGAGGGVGAADLQAAGDGAAHEGLTVALVEQPYRVAGRRAPAPRLDSAWLDVIDRLRAGELAELPLVVGGRSLGARVACRTAGSAGAIGVVCLAFPLLPPRRAASKATPQSRQGELDAVPVATLVVQGRRDQFGVPPAAENRTVVEVAGDHSLRSDPGAVREAVRAWLATLPGLATRGPDYD